MYIVITGGSKGIGKAIAARYASENHNILTGARTESALNATATELKSKFPGCTVEYLPVDLSTKEGVTDFGNWVTDKCVPDILVNNAGTFLPGSVHNEPEGTLQQMIQTNLYSAYRLTRILLPGMIKRKSGHIINNCSIASLKAYDNGGAYSISKFAMAGFSKNLREELKSCNIKVTSLYAGAVFTDSWKDSGLPESRFISINDIAELVYTLSMLSPQACVEELIVRPISGDI